jgi:hypothetical protein
VGAQLNAFLVRWFDPKFVYIESHDDVESKPDFVSLIKNFIKKKFDQKADWETD